MIWLEKLQKLEKGKVLQKRANEAQEKQDMEELVV